MAMSEETPKIKKIILKSHLSLGDIVTLTACVRDCKLHFKDKIQIDVRTSCSEVWQNNEFLTPLKEGDEGVEVINMEYSDIHSSNENNRHFISGYRMFLEGKLGCLIPSQKGYGHIRLSDTEKSWMSQIRELGIKDDFWLVMCCGKSDFTAKWPDPVKIQNVIKKYEGKITFVQVGELHHFHPKLKGAIDLRGKTDLRQLCRLVYHAKGFLSPTTSLPHLFAASESKHGFPQRKAGVVLLGGREPVAWVSYSGQTVLHTSSMLSCCDNGGCWASRASKMGDGDTKDEKHTCLFPIDTGRDYKLNGRKFRFMEAKCLNMITEKRICDAIDMIHDGDMYKFGSSVSRENYSNLSAQAQSLIEF